ncbi:MAG: sigma-70 family RNA polymerase sigma factor [Chloroflexota bacterium]|nr:sigma-70 family RNA polymerase sigma factor [Chloroflexota bacterium]
MIDNDNLPLDLFSQGDEVAFESLFTCYHGALYRVAYGCVWRRDLAEDVVQETFMELYAKPPVLRDNGTLLAGLCRVALNKARNMLRGERRSRQREVSLLSEQEDSDGDPEAQLLKLEGDAQVRDALAQLTEKQRTILLLRHAGLSYAEVAALADVAPGSVGTMLIRAERAFAGAYSNCDPSVTYPLGGTKR